MRIIPAVRPKSQVAQSAPSPSPLPRPRLLKPIVVDEDLFSGPVDLRKLEARPLPEAPAQVDESALSLPLSQVVGARLLTTAASDCHEIHAVQEILEWITERPPQPPQFHLSAHLLPPARFRYCPEKAFIDHRIHDVTHDDAMDRPACPPVCRAFPAHLFAVARAVKPAPKRLPKTRATFSDDPMSGLRLA
jgi:hypothetical protein